MAVNLAKQGMDMMVESQKGCFKEAEEDCIHTDFKVPVRDGNDVEVPVLVHTPKSLIGDQLKPALVYAHGGGVVAGTALQMKGGLSQLAKECGVVCFNVDYRLAPETKCPMNALDFYCAIKHIKENAQEFGVDPARIVIGGDSGGGYIVFAAMVMMAQKNERDLVKLAIPGVPMISDYCFSDPLAMTSEERESAAFMCKIWQSIAKDFAKQKSDPLLFPSKASDELLAQMPPTIIWEMEFDLFITEASRMASRMRRVGRLLEFRVQPGQNHTSSFIPQSQAFKDNMKDYKLALQTYLF